MAAVVHARKAVLWHDSARCLARAAIRGPRQPHTTMPRRRAAAALLVAVSAAQEARHFDFCGLYAFSDWTNDFGTADGVPEGDWDFAAEDPITGAGCRAITKTAGANAIWLEADQEPEDDEEEYTDYSVEVTGRPENRRSRGLGVLLRAHGYDRVTSVTYKELRILGTCAVNTFTAR